MNIVGLLIGIVLWIAVLFIPGIPFWMQSVIRILTVALFVLLIARVYQRWAARKDDGEDL